MTSQAFKHHHYGDSVKDTTTKLPWPSSSPSPLSDATPTHTLIIDGELFSPEAHPRQVAETTTSAPTCQCALPTWKPDGKVSWREMRTCGGPRQHHLHQHQHHHYYQCAAAACSCPSYGLSPSSARQAADPSRISSHTYTHTHLLVQPHKTHTPCPLHAKEHTNCPLLSKEHTHCSLQAEEYTHCPEKQTHIAPCRYHLTDHTHISPSTEQTHITHLTEHRHTTPSTEHTHISPLQKSTHKDIDLYATHLKKPKRRKRQSKLYTPFPSPHAPPYILCQHCFKLLSLPLSPPLHFLTLASVLKVRCALCMRTSFFSTHCRHRMPSSSDVIQLRDIHASKAAKGITDRDFRFKLEQRNIDADVPTIDASSKDEGSLLKVERKSMDAHVPTILASTDVLKREQRSMHTHVDTIDTAADGGILLIREQEIIDMDVLADDMRTAGPNQGIHTPPRSPPKLNPEFAGFSTVQDWVNSLEQESFLHCRTPLIGTGFGSDLLVQGPIDWQIDDEHGSQKFNEPVPGSPLHEHFGYKSPTELLNKPLSSDDEIKMPSDTNSSPSTSATSANTFKPPGFENAHGSACKNTCKSDFMKQGSKNSMKSSADVEQNDQGSLANLFRRSFKGFGERKSSSVSSSKSRVIVNGHTLSQLALKRAEEQAGKLRPGTYWYDSKAGFWGITGGPCLGVLPPFIEELHYPMTRECSNGDTKVFVNGRELHHKDLAVLALRGLSKRPGRAYAVGSDGVVIEETSGLELKHLGKLAPTVERRGKGFGMYMAKQ